MSIANLPAVTTEQPLAVQQPPAPQAPNSPLAFLYDEAAYKHLGRVAMCYSRSQLVPMQFRQKPDDCFIICQLAVRMRVDPFMLMQSTYVVHGRPGFEAKLAIAMLNASGKIKGTLKFTFDGTGDDYGCRAWAIDADTGEKITGPKVDWRMVKGEGWNKDKPLRDGKGVQKSKWNTMPDLMFHYRAATFFIRTNYPEVLMGMQTTEEIADTAMPLHVIAESPASNLLGQEPPQNGDEAEPPFNPPAPEEEAAAEPAVPQSDILPDDEAGSADEAEPPDAAAAADFVLDEWLEAIGKAESIRAVREIVESAKGIPSPHDRERVVSECAKREEEIRGSRGDRSNGGAAETKPADPLEWTRQAAAKCFMFPDWKRLDGYIAAAEWSEETKAEARKIVAAAKAARKASK